MQAYFYIPLLIEIAVIMIVYAFFVRKHTSYGKKMVCLYEMVRNQR